MQATAKDTLAHEEKITLEELPLIYELISKGKSQWRPKNVANKKSPEINCPGRIDLSVRSRWNAGARRGNVNIQYVPGAPTCFVNDYVDIDGQIQPGLKKLGYDLTAEYARAVKEGIAFINGVLFLENYGGRNNPVLCQFVYLHSMHEGAPNFKRTRDLNTRLVFKALIAEKKAAKPLENLEADVEATNLLGSLRFKNGDGTFTYNTPKMDAILGIYSEGGGLSPEDVNQKMGIIYHIFKKHPIGFLTQYKDAISEYDKAIKTGKQLNVLTVGSKEVKMKIGTATRGILTFSKEKKEEQLEELIFHFMTPGAGKNDYNELVSEVEKEKLNALKQ